MEILWNQSLEGMVASFLMAFIGYYFQWSTLSIIALISILFHMWFFRYPEPKKPFITTNNVYAASYGTLEAITRDEKNKTITLTAYLSAFDVHVQNFPVSGSVIDIKEDLRNEFEPAYKPEAKNNNKIIHTVRFSKGDLKVIQIAGMLTRKIVPWDNIGEKVLAGQPLGMIKYGSRVDVEIPSKGIQYLAPIGTILEGNRTILAKY